MLARAQAPQLEELNVKRVSVFWSRRAVELQLPADACLLPGNQHSISPSTASPPHSPPPNTCVSAGAAAYTHLCTQMRTFPLLPRDFSKGCKWLPTAKAVPPPPFRHLLRQFFPNPPKLCHSFRIPKENPHPIPFFAHPSLGNRIMSHLPSV